MTNRTNVIDYKTGKPVAATSKKVYLLITLAFFILLILIGVLGFYFYSNKMGPFADYTPSVPDTYALQFGDHEEATPQELCRLRFRAAQALARIRGESQPDLEDTEYEDCGEGWVPPDP
jgi:hypothetical protein